MGFDAWRTYFRLLLGFSAQPSLAVTAYQTQLGFFRHLLTYDAQWNPAPLFQAPILGTWLSWLGLLLIVTVSVRRVMLTSQDDLTFAVFVIANIILSLVSLDYHYTLLLLPIATLMAQGREWPTFWLKIGLVIAMALIATDLPYRAPRLATGPWALLAYPKLYGALLLWRLALVGGERTGKDADLNRLASIGTGAFRSLWLLT